MKPFFTKFISFIAICIISSSFNTYSQFYKIQDDNQGLVKEIDKDLSHYNEDISKRTQFTRTYNHKNIIGKRITQKSYAPMNQWINNQWLPISDTLKSIGGNKYESNYQIAISGLDINKGYTYFKNGTNETSFNQWALLGKDVNGNVYVLDKPNWSHYNVSSKSIYIKNIFKGIDAEIFFLRGRMKTNFIVKTNHYKQYPFLIFTDKIQYNRNEVSYELASQDGYSKAYVKYDNKNILQINKAVAYVDNNLADTYHELPYIINDDALGIEISTQWIHNNISKGNVIIDPLVYSSDYLEQSKITGSKYSDKCFEAYCSYALSVNIPEKVYITDVRFDFDYIANAPCKVNQGGYSIHMGDCKSPLPAQVYQCSEDNPGVCDAKNISIFRNISSCLSKSYCKSTDVDFELRLYRCNGKADDCGDECIGAASDWVLTIETDNYSITSRNIIGDTVICINNTTTFKRNIVGGAMPYKHIWSTDNEGRIVIDTNEVIRYTPTKSGTYYIYAISTDNCGNVYKDSIKLDVKNVYYKSENVTICKSELPYTWRGITANKGGDSILTKKYSSVYSCDSIYYLNLKVVDVDYKTIKLSLCKSSLPYKWNDITITKEGDSIAKYTTSSKVTGCDSVTYLNLIINDTAKAEVNLSICESALPYTWNGIIVSKEGEAIAKYYSKSKTTSCDSLTILNLSVIKTTIKNISETICSGEKYIIGAKSYNKTGNYSDTFKSSAGCDSIINLNLKVSAVDTVEYSRKICRKEEYVFFDKKLNTPGTYYHTTNIGCDTVWKINLSLNDTFKSTNNISICYGGRHIQGKDTIKSAGTYIFKGLTSLGCDTQLTLNVTMRKLDTIITTITLCSLDSTLFGGKYLNKSGTYWHYDTLGECDRMLKLNLSVVDTIISNYIYNICPGDTLNFRNIVKFHLPGVYPVYRIGAAGCIIRENVTIRYRSASTINIVENLCEGGSFKFRDSVFNTFGKHVYKSIKGCDTTWNITLNKIDSLNSSEEVILCKGDTYSWKSVLYNKEGIYTLNGVNKNGCDTTHTLTIIYNPYDTVTVLDTICSGNNYDFRGNKYSKTGKYYILDTLGSCDTVYSLQLFVTDTIRSTDTITICHGKSYVWNDTNLNKSGTYNFYGKNSSGCDTLYSILLNVTPIDTIIFTDSVCRLEKYSFKDSIYSKAGKYFYNHFSSSNCDTVFEIHLILKDTIRTTSTDTLCSGKKYTWKGVSYDKSGSYLLKGNNKDGCDTLHTLNLYFTNADTLNYLDTTICSGVSFKFFDNSYSKSGVYYYKSIGRDSCISYLSLNLKVSDTLRTKSYDTLCFGMTYFDNGKYYTTSGKYLQYGRNVNGCDTINELNLFISPKVHDTLRAKICLGDSIAYFGKYYKESGTYNKSSIVEECDTINVLILTVMKPFYQADTINLCYGKSIKHGDSIMNTTGVYTYKYKTDIGCDSTYVYNVKILDLPIDTIKVTQCDNISYNFYGKIIKSTGIYIDTVRSTACDTMKVLDYKSLATYQQIRNLVYCKSELPVKYESITIPVGAVSKTNYDTLKYKNILGCDSNIILNLTINDTFIFNIDTVVCSTDKYYFGTTALDTTGNYIFHYKTVNNCDSVYYINLKYTTPVIHQFDTFINCGPIFHKGVHYDDYTILYDTLKNTRGCDSFRHLTVIDARKIYNDTFKITICEGASYLFDNKDLEKSGYYTVYEKTILGCDSIVTLALTVSPNPELDVQYEWLTQQRCQGDAIKIYTKGNYNLSYIYNDDSVMFKSGDIVEMLYPNNVLYITGISEAGCIAKTVLEVNSQACCEIQMPTAFSPNNDGLNDIYLPVTNSTPVEYSFEIYNKWGERIFNSSKIKHGWDGVDYIHNKPSDNGVYYYIIRGKCFDNTPIYMKGDVTLIR